MLLYFIARDFFRFTEFSGSNMCVRKEIFKKIGGFKPVPNSKGIDAIFSTALRKYCKYNKGRIKMISNLAVLTDARFITGKRVINRLHQHKDIARYYEKIANNNEI